MLSIKKARRFIEANPTEPAAQIMAALVLALDSDTNISVPQLYQLNDRQFELALEILNEWRVNKHAASKRRLLASSNQAQALQAASANS